MSAIQQVLSIGSVKSEHPKLHAKAATEYAALVERVTCSGCGSDRMVAILAVINGNVACCPDCSTLTVEERNQIRAALDRVSKQVR